MRSASSHELWLDSKSFQMNSGEILKIDLRNGENFKGVNLSYFSNHIKQLFDKKLEEFILPNSKHLPDVPDLEYFYDYSYSDV